jgi:hypothetical protein
MDWAKQLNESINYIEENHAGEISYDTISKIAGCSVYNFQRMFSYIAEQLKPGIAPAFKPPILRPAHIKFLFSQFALYYIQGFTKTLEMNNLLC